MLYGLEHKELKVLEQSILQYTEFCSEQRHTFVRLFEDAEHTGKVPDKMAHLYSTLDAYKHHMAERAQFFLDRYETSCSILDLVRRSVEVIVETDDDDDSPF